MKHQRGLDYKYPCELQAFKLIPQASTDQHTQKVFMDLLTVMLFSLNAASLSDIEQLPYSSDSPLCQIKLSNKTPAEAFTPPADEK